MSKRILIIDDEESVRDAFTLALRNTDYEIETAADGVIGLEKAKATPQDLIYLDLKMPRMNGVETLEHLREFFDGPIYIVTAFYEEYMESLNRATEAGLDFELCRKPMDAQHIRDLSGYILEEPGLMDS